MKTTPLSNATITQPFRQQHTLTGSLNLDMLGSHVSPPGWQGTTHQHDFWELIGQFSSDTYTLLVDSTTYTLSGQSVFLIPPGHIHQVLNPHTSECILYQDYIGFSLSLPVSPPDNLPVILEYDAPLFFFIKTYFEQYRFSSHMNSAAFIEEKSLAALACTHQLAAWIISKKLSDVQNEEAMTNHHLVSQIQEYLCSNIDSSIQVNQLAQQFFLSPNYLGHVFKSATGVSIKEYHNALRMDCAYQLLKGRQYSVSEVSTYLGFHDLTYFSRKFKAYFHVAPSEVTF